MIELMNWSNRAGLAALYILCSSAFLSPAAANIGTALLVLAFPFAVMNWRALLRQQAVLAALLLAVYILLQTPLAAWRSPDIADHIWTGARGWLRLLVFIPFAYFLGAAPRRLSRLLVLTCIGMIMGMLMNVDWNLIRSHPDQFLHHRTGYRYPAIAFGLYSGAAVLGLVLLARRCWGEPGWTAAKVLRRLMWLVCIVILLQGLVQTYSRGTWIAFTIALVTCLWLVRHSVAVVRIPRSLLALWAAIPVIFIMLNGDQVATRLTEELDTAVKVMRGEKTDVSYSSFELRWNAQLFGLDTWSQRPLLGWGAETSRFLMRTKGNQQIHIRSGDTLLHLHNTYLEILVQFGLIGFSLLFLLIYLLWRGLAHARRAGRIPADYGMYLVILLVFTLVWCLFDYRVVRLDWRIYWTLLAGTTLSFTMPARALPHTGGNSAAVASQHEQPH